MMKFACIMGALLVLAGCSSTDTSSSASAQDSALEQRIDSVLATMTVVDKVGEMTQLTLDMLCVGNPYALDEPHRLDTAKMRHALLDLRVGSILNCGGHTYPREKWHGFITEIQRLSTEEKPTGIPVLYGIDAIHGVNYTDSATLFPQQIALAATWDPEHARRMGEITAYETRASGIPWTFSPVLDLGRDPRWPRFWETFGEDVHLSVAMTEALVDGYQGDVGDPHRVAACMKHYLGYSMPLSGKDRTQAWVPERQLREYFLPTFEQAIASGARTLMVNSGEMNGIPVHVNKAILTDLLRDELGFEGLVVTDWEDIKYLYSRHHVAHDYKEAIVMAIDAGIDMSMVPVDIEFPVLLKELVEEGRVTEARLDESVRRILRVKFELGLFEDPMPTGDGYTEFASETHRQASLNTAREAITLLKNDGVLPLSADASVFVTGPTANSLNDLNGGWSHTWQGTDPKYNTPGKLTIVEALEAQGFDVMHAPLAHDASDEDLQYAFSRARQSDAIILCLGETPYTEKPGDIEDLNLPANQIEMATLAAQLGKPVITVFVQGRPRIITGAVDASDAVVMAYLPGDEGGIALAEILAGVVCPSGKLPFTYPRHASAHVPYDHKYTDRLDPFFGTNAFQPLYEFGHGLSYTEFAYGDLTLDSNTLGESDTLQVHVDVTNTGSRSGSEVVQVFVADSVASITPSVKRLRAFTKLELLPGQTKRVDFSIAVQDLAFVGHDMQWIVEPGLFGVSVADLIARFEVTEPTPTP